MSRLSGALLLLLVALALTLPACGGADDDLGAPTTTVVAAMRTDTAEVVASPVEDKGKGKGPDKDKPHRPDDPQGKKDGRGHGNAYGHLKKDD